jgi:multidrug resistance protein, MATE family
MSSLRDEIVATFALSWPIVLTNLAMNFMVTTDLMFLGRLSPEALAAASLGFNVYTPLLLFCIGVVSAAAPLAATKVGANAHDWAGVRKVAHQAFLTALLLALPFWIFFWNVSTLLKAIGEPPEIADLSGRYMHGLQWALAPALLYMSARSILSALNRVGPVLIAGLLAVGCNALTNYTLVFGHFGFPALGVFGSGLATTFSQTLMFVLLIAYSRIDPRLAPHRLFFGRWRFDATEFAALWRLGAPIGLFIAAEVGTFGFAALAMGLLGAAQIQAHAIALNIAGMTFMVPLGLGMAATVRVGHAYGARDRAAVSRAGWTAFGLAIVFALTCSLAMALAPRLLISAFIDTEAPRNAATLDFALGFVRIAALFQLVDSAQGVLANMLRGAHDSRAPMQMALIGYWLIGAPTGLALAFLTPLNGFGLWIGLAVGLTAVATMLLARWRGKERAGFFPAAVPGGLP